MSDFYNAFGKFVSMSTIEGFAVDIKKDDEILKEIDQLKLKIESGKITKEQIITEIEKLNSLKENKDTSVAVKNAIELLVKNSISKIDGIKFTGNMELSGVMKSKGYYLSDGTKVNEVTRVINKLAVPLDKDGHLNIQPPLGKKVKATVNELNIPKNGRITFGDKEDNDPYHLRKIGNTDNNHLRLTLNDNNNESLQIWGDSCKTDKCAADGGTVKHVFDTNGNASHTGGMKVTGGRSHFKDAENKGRVRVGAAWGIPGFYSEDNQDIVVGVPRNRKVNLGTAGKFVEITGNGNMKVPSDINTPVLSRIGGDWLRINQQGNSAGKVAAYGGFSINDTRSRSGGLSVGSWAPPGRGNITATGSIGASGINIINGKNNRGNPDGAPTHFNYNGKGENYIRGYTIHQGELRILNPKNENNMGWGTHFNHEGKGRNYIRGKTEMRGDVNFIGNIKTDGKICINNTCITEADLKKMIPFSNKFTNTTIKTGVAEWISNPTAATAKYGHIKDWDTSAVTNMTNLFQNRTTFNDDISNWNVSNVTNMYRMFGSAIKFNQPIGKWDVSKVQNMAYMFTSARSFNQPIGNWNVSKVTNMRGMFQIATAFNQPIGSWDVSKVTDMTYLFLGAKSFNQPISKWDVSNVTSMYYMFVDAYKFNQPIGNWDVSKVKDFYAMFQNAKEFNQNISGWKFKAGARTNYFGWNYTRIAAGNKPPKYLV